MSGEELKVSAESTIAFIALREEKKTARHTKKARTNIGIFRGDV